MTEFSFSSPDFEDGGEIPKKFGYKFENFEPKIRIPDGPEGTVSAVLIMDDPDAMKAVGKVWVHWLMCNMLLPVHEDEADLSTIYGKTDFGETKYGGPAPPDGKHTYVFKAYAIDTFLDLKEGYSKQELEDAMKGHILAEAKLTGTFAP
jgi:Raf kinase inhibitor-like YbhB/YbcL family protein